MSGGEGKLVRERACVCVCVYCTAPLLSLVGYALQAHAWRWGSSWVARRSARAPVEQDVLEAAAGRRTANMSPLRPSPWGSRQLAVVARAARLPVRAAVAAARAGRLLPQAVRCRRAAAQVGQTAAAGDFGVVLPARLARVQVCCAVASAQVRWVQIVLHSPWQHWAEPQQSRHSPAHAFPVEVPWRRYQTERLACARRSHLRSAIRRRCAAQAWLAAPCPPAGQAAHVAWYVMLAMSASESVSRSRAPGTGTVVRVCERAGVLSGCTSLRSPFHSQGVRT